ncbi:UNVERIFIED_CONTAM: hypothetical protein HDU68_012385 [Siphonaria sp. JEL0065]|nr:hypothetical protein HDU68_012385 [Siphonaria sp. JEL0065]
MSIFSLFTLTVLFILIATYLGSLISLSFLPASQRRVMVKGLRDISKRKEFQFAFTGTISVIGLLFIESVTALYKIWQEHDERTVGERESFHHQLKIIRAEKHLITSGFALMMAIVVFMRLREKNNYIKLLEKYEHKEEGAESNPEVADAEKKDN